MNRPSYSIVRKSALPPVSAAWRATWWADVPALDVSIFFHESTRHRPPTWAKVAYTAEAIHVLFHVKDRFVRCMNSTFHSPVWRDSCVEFFVQPRPELPLDEGGGYFNIEINCGGVPLVNYIVNPKKIGDLPTKFQRLKAEELRQFRIVSSIATPIPFEHPEPLEWSLQYSIPVAVLEKYVGRLGPLGGQRWRGNFFKCAELSKYPHWGSWAGIGSEANYHQPGRFGSLYFRQI